MAIYKAQVKHVIQLKLLDLNQRVTLVNKLPLYNYLLSYITGSCHNIFFKHFNHFIEPNIKHCLSEMAEL